MLYSHLFTQHGKIIKYNLGSHRLPRTTLTRNQNTLIGRHGLGHNIHILALSASSDGTTTSRSMRRRKHLILNTAHHGTIGLIGGFVGVWWEGGDWLGCFGLFKGGGVDEWLSVMRRDDGRTND